MQSSYYLEYRNPVKGQRYEIRDMMYLVAVAMIGPPGHPFQNVCALLGEANDPTDRDTNVTEV